LPFARAKILIDGQRHGRRQTVGHVERCEDIGRTAWPAMQVSPFPSVRRADRSPAATAGRSASLIHLAPLQSTGRYREERKICVGPRIWQGSFG
jgi:hypothetical protein